tara:strand:+ start:134 stop:1471 length:1338 start_codon:yes stop_codon:yes gene_type:complete
MANTRLECSGIVIEKCANVPRGDACEHYYQPDIQVGLEAGFNSAPHTAWQCSRKYGTQECEVSRNPFQRFVDTSGAKVSSLVGGGSLGKDPRCSIPSIDLQKARILTKVSVAGLDPTDGKAVAREIVKHRGSSAYIAALKEVYNTRLMHHRQSEIEACSAPILGPIKTKCRFVKSAMFLQKVCENHKDERLSVCDNNHMPKMPEEFLHDLEAAKSMKNVTPLHRVTKADADMIKSMFSKNGSKDNLTTDFVDVMNEKQQDWNAYKHITRQINNSNPGRQYAATQKILQYVCHNKAECEKKTNNVLGVMSMMQPAKYARIMEGALDAPIYDRKGTNAVIGYVAQPVPNQGGSGRVTESRTNRFANVPDESDVWLNQELRKQNVKTQHSNIQRQEHEQFDQAIQELQDLRKKMSDPDYFRNSKVSSPGVMKQQLPKSPVSPVSIIHS